MSDRMKKKNKRRKEEETEENMNDARPVRKYNCSTDQHSATLHQRQAGQQITSSILFLSLFLSGRNLRDRVGDCVT